MKEKKKTLGRPTLNAKTKITLSIENEILKSIRKYALDKKKSLSQLSEELYQSLLHNEKLLNENPKELKKMVDISIPMLLERIKQEEEDKKS